MRRTPASLLGRLEGVKHIVSAHPDDRHYVENDLQDLVENKAWERFLAICAGVTAMLTRVSDDADRALVRSLLAQGQRQRERVNLAPSELDALLDDARVR